MRPFTYARVSSLNEAARESSRPGAMVLAGGTTLVDLMRGNVLAPDHLVDIRRLPGLDGVEETGTWLRIGALSRMADVATDERVRARYPAIAESLRLAASQQVRNMATIGGNLLQRTRCPYYRDGDSPCNKREPGTGCSALAGPDRDSAVLGGSESCVAVYPGDLGVSLVAFEASVELLSAGGPKTLPFAELHRDVADEPERETTLSPGDIVTAVTIPNSALVRGSAYVKVADRARYAFAIASAAAGLTIEDGVVTAARVGLGGVATRPWRSHEAEAELVGRPLTADTAKAAGRAAFAAARAGRDNAVKITLGPRVVEQACLRAGQGGERA
ncbi:FAD binding domain-containing protein [Herbidospora mongoliensis]|uniref:FAD binding domain-containing protein n=1 Tax=Herbidospora mongoliensis TaxID=688067 RepID=UPI0008309EB6|nr:xanthine dehydrogenase family protein subunit M [Herbidospora mongoliensis]